MKCRNLFSAFLITGILLSQVTQAGEYAGYVRNWWVEENGNITFYVLNETNTAYVNGLCGSGVYRLKVSNANFDEAFTSLKDAAIRSYMVRMYVTACDGTINVIRQPKICTWTGDC